MAVTVLVAGVSVLLSCVGAFSKPGRQEPSSQAPPRFQAEIRRLAVEGLKVKETLDVSAGAKKFLAAVFERANQTDLQSAHEFRVLESDGDVVRTIFRRADFFFSFSALGSMAAMNASDINGDGLIEVLVQSSSGGNCWSCNPVEIYQLAERKTQLIAAGPISRITDLDKDRVMELLVADARWEFYGELSHAASPSAIIIYSWRGGRYVYASSDFPLFYKAETDRLRTEIEEAKREISAADFSDEVYVGRAVALALTYAHSGDVEKGLLELEGLLRSNIRSENQAQRRAAIIKDFRNGESFKKLGEMKRDTPMPLG